MFNALIVRLCTVMLILLALVLTRTSLFGQPSICGSNPSMTSFCPEACIICDIDGFTGRNNSTIRGQAPPGFCTSFVHHMQWIGFIAGTENLSLELRVFNCVSGSGLEVGLYESLDCTTFSRVSECDTDIRENEIRLFTNTVPLVVGQYYYLVMDGNANDVCNYFIKVTSGSTMVAPLSMPAEIIMPDVICQHETFDMETPGISGATVYHWEIDSVSFKNGTKVSHSFDKPGVYKVCLYASNVCSASPAACKTIQVLPVAETTISQQICFGECYTYGGKKYCETNIYPVIFKSYNGCDSIVNLDLLVDDRITSSVDLFVCERDTLSIGNGKFYTEGKHQTVISNNEGCNIYLDINLTLIVCNIKSSLSVTPVICNGENSGIIRFTIDAGTPPFTYSGFKIENPSVTFSGFIEKLNESIDIAGLDEGNYAIAVKDNFGNSRIINVFVPQPSKLVAISKTSAYHDFQISCHGATDGFLVIRPQGGIHPYTFSHEGFAGSKDSLYNLKAGIYRSSVTDGNGCTTAVETNIRQPDSLIMLAGFINPGCDGLNTGIVEIKDIKGGDRPFTYMLNNGKPEITGTFTGLEGGYYQLEVTDVNGCIAEQNGTLISPEIPVLHVANPINNVLLGDTVVLEVTSNLLEQTVTWSPSSGLHCKECLITGFQPLRNTDFVISVTSKDGCERKENIKVNVIKRRSFVMSNIISSNSDNVNDNIRYFAGNDVAGIVSFAVFDRWGNLVFKKENLPKGLDEIAWNGSFNGQALVAGVYSILTEVRYIDDETILYQGSLTILQ